MKDVNRKVDKLKALIIKEQKLLLDVLATMTRQDKSAVDLTVDVHGFTRYNAILAKQLQLLSRVFNQQINKQSIIAFDEEEGQNSIRIDNFEDNRLRQDDDIETAHEAAISLADDTKVDSIQSESGRSEPNIR